MRENLGILVCVWVVLCGSCLGRFVVEKNSLKVTSPDSLKNVYECAIGNFGVPEYGGTLVGSVYYPKSNQKACSSFNTDEALKKRPGGLPIFLLADRGGIISLLFWLFLGLMIFLMRALLYCYSSLLCHFNLVADCLCGSLLELRRLWFCISYSEGRADVLLVLNYEYMCCANASNLLEFISLE